MHACLPESQKSVPLSSGMPNLGKLAECCHAASLLQRHTLLSMYWGTAHFSHGIQTSCSCVLRCTGPSMADHYVEVPGVDGHGGVTALNVDGNGKKDDNGKPGAYNPKALVTPCHVHSC